MPPIDNDISQQLEALAQDRVWPASRQLTPGIMSQRFELENSLANNSSEPYESLNDTNDLRGLQLFRTPRTPPIWGQRTGPATSTQPETDFNSNSDNLIRIRHSPSNSSTNTLNTSIASSIPRNTNRWDRRQFRRFLHDQVNRYWTDSDLSSGPSSRQSQQQLPAARDSHTTNSTSSSSLSSISMPSRTPSSLSVIIDQLIARIPAVPNNRLISDEGSVSSNSTSESSSAPPQVEMVSRFHSSYIQNLIQSHTNESSRLLAEMRDSNPERHDERDSSDNIPPFRTQLSDEQLIDLLDGFRNVSSRSDMLSLSSLRMSELIQSSKMRTPGNIQYSSWLVQGREFSGSSSNCLLPPLTSSAETFLNRSFDVISTIRMTIHDVDYKDKQISGVLERSSNGYNSRNRVFAYWRGEMIDFDRHNLKTMKEDMFDEMYINEVNSWRVLEPFQSLSEDLKTSFDANSYLYEVQQNYILLRWKEISAYHEAKRQNAVDCLKGSYFISIRRSDGFIDGCYHDYRGLNDRKIQMNPLRQGYSTFTLA